MVSLNKSHTKQTSLLLSLLVAFGFSSTASAVKVEKFEIMPKNLETMGYEPDSSLTLGEGAVSKGKDGRDFGDTSGIIGFIDKGGKPVGIEANGWIPTGAHQFPVSPECHPSVLEDRILNFKGTGPQRQNIYRAYFDQCEKELMRFGKSGISALLKFFKIQYDAYDNNEIQPFQMRFSNGEVTKGFVAIKSDPRKRPFVIVKCGLTCDGGLTGTTRSMLMHLYEESPFNLIVLGSHSSALNAIDNRRVVFGGFYEGQELYEIASWLRQSSPFKDKVMAVHLLGISLGGHAALYAGLYNDLHYAPRETVYDSITAYCPAVDLKGSMDHLFLRGGIVGNVVFDNVWKTMKEAYDDVPDLHDLVDKNKKPKRKEFPPIMAQAATRFLGRLDPNKFLQPFTGSAVDQPEKFWTVNNFVPYSHHIKTPLLVWASKDDVVVKNDLNAGLLEKKNLNSPNEALQVLNVQKGTHCAKVMAYGWQTVTRLLRTFIMINSPKLMAQREFKKATLDWQDPRKGRRQMHISQEWVAVSGKDHVEINYKIWEKGSGCRKPFASKENCYAVRKAKVPYSRLPIKLDVPSSEPRAQALTRWLNSRFELLDTEGRPLRGSSNDVAAVRWVEYYQ